MLKVRYRKVFMPGRPREPQPSGLLKGLIDFPGKKSFLGIGPVKVVIICALAGI
jgi:hypothetical protein